MRLWLTTTENNVLGIIDNNIINLKPIITCHLQFVLKMLWM